MQKDHTRPSGGEQQHPSTAPWWHVRWFCICLFLLVAACAPAPVPSSITPTASGPVLSTTITAYHGHTSTVFTVAWSPDRRRIASGGNDSTVQVWDAMTGHLISSYPVASSTTYADGTLSVAWSPDSAHIASGGADTEVHLWSAPACRV